MTINWETITISIVSSGAISAIITAIWNEQTQIKAIKESGLYVKRVNVLDQMLKKLEETDREIGSLIILPKKNKGLLIGSSEIEKGRKILADFYFYFLENRHYLSKEIAEEINNFSKKYINTFKDFLDRKTVKNEEWYRLIEEQNKEINIQKEKIVDDFRKLLGVK